jgi:hypothetical protein
LAPEPVVDFETRRPKADENGEPLYTVQLLVMGEDSADLIAVKVPGVPSAGIRQGASVKVSGLVAQPWTMADRSGVSFRAARIEPGHRPSQGQLAKGGHETKHGARRRGRQIGCWEPGRPLHHHGLGARNTDGHCIKWSPDASSS